MKNAIQMICELKDETERIRKKNFSNQAARIMQYGKSAQRKAPVR